MAAGTALGQTQRFLRVDSILRFLLHFSASIEELFTPPVKMEPRKRGGGYVTRLNNKKGSEVKLNSSQT